MRAVLTGRCAAGGLLVLGTLCVLLGGRMLLADLSAFQASAFLGDWSERRERPSEEAWRVAHAAAIRAVRFSPVPAASHFDRLGVVYQWRDNNALFGDVGARESREAALRAYREAAVLRPLWPHGQVRIAGIKLALLEFDGDFDAALRRAVALGPWRTSVNEPVARIGLTAWHDLTLEQRELVLESARRASAEPAAARRLVEQASRLRLQDEVCSALDTGSPAHQRHCGA